MQLSHARPYARFLAAAAVATVCAAQASAESLEDALALAYESNPTLAAEQARVRALDESYVQARSAALPSLTANVQTTASSSERSGVDPSFGFALPGSDTDSVNYSISADQTLFRGGRTRASMDSAMASILSAREQLRSVEQTVLVDTIAAYMDVRRDEAIVTIRANNVTVLERQLQASRDRFEVGEITRTDVSQAEARLAGARSEFAAAQAALNASRAAYERIVGRPPGTLEDPPPLLALPETLDAAWALAMENNPDVASAAYAEESAEASVRNAKGAMYPTVSVSASASNSETYRGGPFEYAGSPSETEQTQIGGRVSIPLFAGNANSSALRQARQTESRARLQLRDTERRARETVSAAWSAYLAAQSQTVSSGEQVRANELAFEGVEAEAEVGLRTTLDVLNAEQELLNARLALVQADREAYVAGFRVLQAIGEVDPMSLGLDVEVYDPSVNLSSIRRRYLGIGLLE